MSTESNNSTYSELLDNLLLNYHDDVKNMKEDSLKDPEFEIRFGRLITISKHDFDNVVSKLINKGFKTENVYGDDLLRISFNENEDLKDVRIEFEGKDIIEKVCSDELQTINEKFMASNLTPNISLIKKEFDKNKEFENKDYGFVASQRP